MPFGRFKGRPLDQVPDTYLLWLACLDDLREPLLWHVLHEMERRILTGDRVVEADMCTDDKGVE